MLVTIYTDASFNPDTGDSAGAAWIKSNSGILKVTENYQATSSTHAEIIIAHCSILLAHNKWPDMKIVCVNTDSLNLCHMMWPFHNAEPKSKDIIREITAIRQFCNSNNIETRFKHVKGHQSKRNSSIKAFLNNWCDEHASITRINGKEE